MLLTSLATSCNDYLDVLPLNEVVLENFWTERKDVYSVLNSCYESLEDKESIKRMEVWGELRSENIVAGNASYEFNDALNETLLPTSSLTSWAIFYKTINRCNTVIHYAPKVQEIDPNYTYAELQSNIAEATFIRDLCYFYLLRTFGEVPITFEPSIDDDTEFEISPTVGFKYENGGWVMGPALDMLISDLQKVEDSAVRRYYDDSNIYKTSSNELANRNSGRVTRNAIYALLAELNLWKGDYDETIRYCDLIIDAKRKQYEEKRDKDPKNVKDMMLFDDIPLIKECPDGEDKCGNAYNEIFGAGNSFESIFELEFYENYGIHNEITDFNQGSQIYPLYGYKEQTLGKLATTDDNSKDVASGTNDVWEKKKDDCRVYAIMKDENGRNTITKYVARTVYMSKNLSNVTKLDDVKLDLQRRGAGDGYANWIIYRLTDIMLMKAEALVMKGESNYEEAFKLVDAVNCRARNITTGSSLTYSRYSSSKSKMMEDLILKERKREFMFEGKRWYDLVRYSIHTGSNTFLANQVTTKYQMNVNAIKIKLSNPNTLFWPFNKEELKLNKNLKQNSAYGDTEDFK